MARKRMNFVGLLVGLSAILASIAVGVAMTTGTIAVPIVGVLINQIAGWVVVVGGILAGLRTFGLIN